MVRTLTVSSLFISFLFLEREEEREGNIDVQEKHGLVASHKLPTWDLAHNPGMCSDQELNQQCFGSQAGTQSTEPHQPGLTVFTLNLFFL